MRRRHNTVRRIITLIDVLAPLRKGATAGDLTRKVNDATGDDYSYRTIQRDLLSLEEIGMVFCLDSKKSTRKMPDGWLWFLNLSRSKVLEELAIERECSRNSTPVKCSVGNTGRWKEIVSASQRVNIRDHGLTKQERDTFRKWLQFNGYKWVAVNTYEKCS